MLYLAFAFPIAAIAALLLLILLMIWLLPKVWRAVLGIFQRIAALFGHLSPERGSGE